VFGWLAFEEYLAYALVGRPWSFGRLGGVRVGGWCLGKMVVARVEFRVTRFKADETSEAWVFPVWAGDRVCTQSENETQEKA